MPRKKKSASQLDREIATALAAPVEHDEEEAERVAQAEYAEQKLRRQQSANDDWRKHEGATNYEDKLTYWNAYAKKWGLAKAVERATTAVAGNFLSRDFGETAASFYARNPAARATRDWLDTQRI